ncbi:hypothetical protein [Candidatus Harpocratesius sp.]
MILTLSQSFSPNSQNITNFEGKDNNSVMKESTNLSSTPTTPQFITNSVPQIAAENVLQLNVSQFDVREDIRSITPQSRIDVDNENLTIQIPTGWNINSHDFNISALYKPWQMISDQNVTLNYTSNPVSPWNFISFNPPDLLKWGLTGNFDDEMLNIIGTNGGGIGNTIPDSALAEWYQWMEKPDPNLTIYETDKISSGQVQYPLYNEFTVEPDWGNTQVTNETGNDWQKKLENPFGGESGTATRQLSYDDVGDQLEAYIHAGSSNFTLGNPSIGWQVNFTDPTAPDFIPKQFLLSIAWSIENLAYDASDNLSVIVKVDGQYVDGRFDKDNNYYPNATSTTIETSVNNSEYLDHDMITRTFDITNLIDTTKVNHTVEFGIWFEGINETTDEVQVNFGGIAVAAIEEDQYKIGDLEFKCSIDFPAVRDVRYWYLFSYISDGVDGIFIPLGLLTDIFGVTIKGSKILNFNLTTRLRYFLNNDSYLVSLGIINVGGARTAPTTDFTVSFDDISLSPFYKTDNFSKAGFQIFNGTGWQNITRQLIHPLIPYHNNNLTLQFRTTNSTYANSTLDFTSVISISRVRSNDSEATYYVKDVQPNSNPTIYWNVTFNNTNTFEQYINNNFHNFVAIQYNFTIIDIPAWDNKGNNSEDWYWYSAIDPLGDTPDYASAVRLNGTGNSGIIQNASVMDATKPMGSTENPWYINGTWNLQFTSKNYVEFVGIKQQSGDSTRFFAGNQTIISLNRSGSAGIIGNYNITIKNSSGSIITGYPKYYQSSNNISDTWSVQDFGVGTYQIVGIWNDSSASTGKTTRVGILISTFGVWRCSQASIRINPDSLNSGEKGSFYLNFSEEDGTPISGAEDYIQLYLNSTDSIWGMDWPPYQALVDPVVENSSLNAEGNYTLTFKTRSVPTGNYLVYIKIEMPFYEFQRLGNAWINISGYAIDFEFLSGAYNISRYFGYVNEGNFPIVNDTTHSIIEVKITNHTNGVPLENGQISGTFNGTDNVFYGDEIFRDTQIESDKGKYRIYIIGTGLNTTNIAGIFNYSLTITVAVDGYNSTYMKLSTNVLPIMTKLTADNAIDTYEGGEIDFYATYQNINNPSAPLPLNNASVNWQLRDNNTNNVAATGDLSLILAGVYKTTILLSTDSYYLSPGYYQLEINASQFNCANASWIQVDVHILAKHDTQLSLAINELIQIGSDLNVRANLTYSNGTALKNTEISIQINYTGEDPFNIVSTTDNLGIATYTQTVPTQFAGKYLSIKATYAGTSTIREVSAQILNRLVKGKNEVNLTLMCNSTIQVGYSVSLIGQLSIEGFSQYADIFVTIAGWYDGNSENLFFLQQIYPSIDGVINFNTPEIEDGHQEITFFVDYAGTSTIEYASDQIGAFPIIPKWETNFTLFNISSNFRIGQTITFDVYAEFLNPNSTESFYGASFYIIYDYPSQHLITEYYLDEFNRSTVDFLIPQDCGDYLNVTIDYSGNSKILSFTYTYHFTVLPKWSITLNFQNLTGFTRIGQDIQFNVSVAFNETGLSMSILQGKKFYVIYQYSGSNQIFTEYIFSTYPVYEITYHIPQDCGDFLNILILFQEDSIIQEFNQTITLSISPKWSFSLELQDLSENLRIGQTIHFNISVIYNETGFSMTMLQGSKFFLIYQYTGSNQIFTDYIFSNIQLYEVEYLIPQDCGNYLNITLLFQEDDYIQEFNQTISLEIKPKWIPLVEIESIQENLRQGQRFEIVLTANFTDANVTAEFTEIRAFIEISIGNILSTFNYSFDEFGKIRFNYTVPISDTMDMLISVNTIETQTIDNYETFQLIKTLPQMETNLVIIGATSQEDFAGEFSIKIQLLDSEGNGIEGERIWFILKNENSVEVKNSSAITNEEGIAVTTFQIDSVGEYYVEPLFMSDGIYKEASISTNSAEISSLRVVNVWIRIWDNIIVISIATGCFIALSSIYYRGFYVPRKRKQIAALMEMHQRFVDIENLQYLMIIHKSAGLSLFSQTFTEIPIDGNLISGFLSAITSFGKEIGSKVSNSTESDAANAEYITSEEKSTGLEELAYKQFKIVMIEGNYVKIAVLLLKSASDTLKDKIKEFTSAFESENSEILPNWSGKMLPPEPIVRLIETHLFADLLYEHRLAQSKVSLYSRGLKRKSIKMLIIQEAVNKFNYSFKVREMIIALTAYGKKDVDTFNAINELRNDGVVFAINSRTRQLIEQFKPLIQPLTKEQRQTLIAIESGIYDNNKLEKVTKIPLIIPVITALKRHELITDTNELTEQGEIIATLLTLIPDI